MAYDPTRTTIAKEVLPFTADNLANALSNRRWLLPEAIKKKNQFHYFYAYLGSLPEEGGLGAKTILIEKPYVSQSYLSDYADYYARGFAKYSRFCTRVHFFALEFDERMLEIALTERENSALWESYLGYIVVKPLPATPIGATLLKTYLDTGAKRRHFPAQRPYEVNILGKKININTLIFQEQDANVSGCATTALWVAFHKTAHMFQTPLPSPYQITASTGNLFHNNGRSFPTVALDLYQVGKAIEAVGLVAELRKYKSADSLHAQATVFAQAQLLEQNEMLAQVELEEQDTLLAQAELVTQAAAGEATAIKSGKSVDVVENVEEQQALVEEQIPTAGELTDEIFKLLAENQLSEIKGFIYAYLRLGLPVLLFLDFYDGDRHLVTVTGYREAAPASYLSVPGITLLSSSIERLYVHDDQIGPYARLGFGIDGSLETEWPQPARPDHRRSALLESISVPVIRDIRIHYEQVYGQTAVIDQVLYNILRAKEDFVWDIYLSYSNDYKESLLRKPPTSYQHLGKIVERLLPKYVWVARATLGQKKTVIVDLIFDATDLHTGFYCILTNLYEPARTPLRQWFSQPQNQSELADSLDFEPRYLELFLHDLNITEDSVPAPH